MITATTRAQIKGFLEGFIQGLVDELTSRPRISSAQRAARTSSTKGDMLPFHEALLPEAILRINTFERSLSTKLGTTFEEAARLIGLEYHAEAQRGYVMSGDIALQAIRTIEHLVDQIDHNGVQRLYPDLIHEVLASNTGSTDSRTRRADLYLRDHHGNEYFFEMKSPKPNKGQCLEVTSRLLHMHAFRNLPPPRAQTYFGMAYNPYGDRAHYNHSFTKRYLDFDNQVVIGEEFWELVGGPGTYTEVLGIYQEVGREKGKHIIDALAFDF